MLLPGTELIALEDLPPCKTWVYVLMYVVFFGALPVLIYLTIEEVADPLDYIINVFAINTAIVLCVIYLAGILNVFFGVKTAYTRKIVHISLFSLPFIIDALLGGLDEEESTATVTLGWNLWSAQISFLLMTIPSRKILNYCLGDIRDKDNPKCKRFLNFPSLVLAAMDRAEDRPNTLKWIQTQIVLMYIFIIVISAVNEEVDLIAVETVILVPTIIGGFGDGLAEPVGRKWGANYQYRTHGCCTEYDYVRSYPGSLMVWISGIVAVGFNFAEFSTIQFVIAMVIIPIVGTVTEAKAPHTMDNPFIVLFVGITVMLIAAIPV